MLKSEKMLLQHHKNKKQHTKKINSPWATFLWNGDTDKISFLKAEAELNGKTNCETLNVTSPLSSLSKQRTLTWPELLQLLFRTEIRKKKKNSCKLLKLEGRNRRARMYSKLQCVVCCMGNSACWISQTKPLPLTQTSLEVMQVPASLITQVHSKLHWSPDRPFPGRTQTRCALASFIPSCATSFRIDKFS